MVTVLRAIRFTLVFAILLGVLYPLVVFGIARGVFPYQSQGSVITANGKTVGSMLIAQAVTNPEYFQPRPSAVNYEGNNSGGSNLGPTNPALVSEVRKNLQAVEAQNPGVNPSKIPPSMVESSASGLDPDITLADARIQIPRIAKASGLSESYLNGLVQQYARHPFLGLFGSEHVNVNRLNLAIHSKLA